MPSIARNVPHSEFEDMVRRAEEADGPRPESAIAQTEPYDEPVLPTYPDVKEQYGIPDGEGYPRPDIPEGVIPAPGQDLPPGLQQALPVIPDEAPSEPVDVAPPVNIPPPLPGSIPRPTETPAELSAADNIIEAADADIYEAEGFDDAGPFGDIADRAKEMAHKIEREEDDDASPPEVQEAEAHGTEASTSGVMHGIAGRISNVAHQLQDAILDAAADDILDGYEDADAHEDTDTNTGRHTGTSHAPDPADDDPYADET